MTMTARDHALNLLDALGYNASDAGIPDTDRTDILLAFCSLLASQRRALDRQIELAEHLFGPDPQPEDFPGLDTDGNACTYADPDYCAGTLRSVQLNGTPNGQHICQAHAHDLEDRGR